MPPTGHARSANSPVSIFGDALMPIFEYRCRKCRHDFEYFLRGSDEPACPDCGSRDAEKLLSAPSGHVAGGLPIASSCPPPNAPPCGPGCCRLP
ncbi:MAG: zinc ribbon domain-containing protein [Planctomycetaceae bacterium]